jgi:DNA-binding NarL/FixJ family response regulator
MTTSKKHRNAVLADCHPLWLEAVENVIAPMGFEVVCKTVSPLEALKVIEELRPNLFVTSLEWGGGNGDRLAIVRKARDLVPSLKIIVLGSDARSESVDGSFAAGAAAYILRTAEPEDLRLAVRAAFGGTVYLPLVRSQAQPPPPPRLALEAAQLTRRELEILALVAEGLPNAEIARRLWVAEQTVKFHLSNIYRKLGVSNRTEAAYKAVAHGLLPSKQASAIG